MNASEPHPGADLIDLRPAEGPAFPLAVRLLATALVGGTIFWGLGSSAQLLEADWATPSAAVLAVAGGLAAWCLLAMWRSRTRVDHDGIYQTWIIDKRVRWDQVMQARLVGVPFLGWLVTPRLVVRPKGGGIVVFHSADPRVLAVFASFAMTGSPLIAAAHR